MVFDLRKVLIPLAERLDINGADIFVPLAQQVGDKMAADEAAAAANHDFIVHHSKLKRFRE